MKTILIFFALIVICVNLHAQTNNPWLFEDYHFPPEGGEKSASIEYAPNGIAFTPKGDLRVLIVCAGFGSPYDGFDCGNWGTGSKEQQTQLTQLKQEIDQLASTSSLKSATITTGTNNLTETQARLDQNIPNPFSNETKIGCFIPDEANISVLYIYNMNGTQLQQYSINGNGKQSVTINGNSLVPGMYLYALVIDGKEVDTKRMILTK